MGLNAGDRVRVIEADSPYTGCRGTIASSPETHSSDMAPLGYHVAIDGENGVTRPFLTAALEPLGPVRVQPDRAGRAARREEAG